MSRSDGLYRYNDFEVFKLSLSSFNSDNASTTAVGEDVDDNDQVVGGGRSNDDDSWRVLRRYPNDWSRNAVFSHATRKPMSGAIMDAIEGQCRGREGGVFVWVGWGLGWLWLVGGARSNCTLGGRSEMNGNPTQLVATVIKKKSSFRKHRYSRDYPSVVLFVITGVFGF